VIFYFVDPSYSKGMNELMPLNAGCWKLALAPKSFRSQSLTLAARLAERGPLLVLDGGNQFNAYQVARVARGQPEILNRIQVSRAFTCYQMTSLLEGMIANHESILLLDFLSTFYDESASFPDRCRLLQICLVHIGRLSQTNGLLVIAHPPALPSPEADHLIECLASQANELWTAELPAPIVIQPALF
jgi:hypothetical protein